MGNDMITNTDPRQGLPEQSKTHQPILDQIIVLSLVEFLKN